jgi:hypothetical protein
MFSNSGEQLHENLRRNFWEEIRELFEIREGDQNDGRFED